MPGISVVGMDSAGGVITGGRQSFATYNGSPISVVGDAVSGHGDGPHRGPTIVQGSSFFTINGIPVVISGKLASCGHAASGRSNWTVSN